MGIRIDKEEFIAALHVSTQGLKRQNNALKAAIEACDSLIEQNHLSGKEWNTLRNSLRKHTRPALKARIQSNKNIIKNNAKTEKMLDDSPLFSQENTQKIREIIEFTETSEKLLDTIQKVLDIPNADERMDEVIYGSPTGTGASSLAKSPQSGHTPGNDTNLMSWISDAESASVSHQQHPHDVSKTGREDISGKSKV